MAYTLTVTVPAPHGQTLERTRAVLADQGFGVLTEIDVKATFSAKLGEEAAEAVGDYVILGACNPGLASKGLAAEAQLGALLPCNVVVRRGSSDEQTTVDAIDPQTMVELSGSPQVREVADDADARLRAALSAISEVGPDNG